MISSHARHRDALHVKLRDEKKKRRRAEKMKRKKRRDKVRAERAARRAAGEDVPDNDEDVESELSEDSARVC